MIRLAFTEVEAPDAGWSSLVARRAHNPKVVSSNLAPATNFLLSISILLERIKISKARLLYS